MWDHKCVSGSICAGILLVLGACSEPADTPDSATGADDTKDTKDIAAVVTLQPEETTARTYPATPPLLTERGYGSIAIGDKADATALQFDVLEDTYDCTHGQLAGHERVYFMVIGGEVARIDIEDPAEDRLPNGLGIGSTGDAVIAAYPDAEISPHKYVDDAHYYEVTLDSGLGLVFEETDGRVTSFRLGRFPEVGYVEGCS